MITRARGESRLETVEVDVHQSGCLNMVSNRLSYSSVYIFIYSHYTRMILFIRRVLYFVAHTIMFIEILYLLVIYNSKYNNSISIVYRFRLPVDRI